jgi:hypothetical protein
VSETGPDRPTVQRFVLRGPSPIPALGVAAASTVLGAVLLVLSSVYGLPLVVSILAVILLVVGAALVLGAALAHGRLRQRVELSEMGLRMSSGRRSMAVSWADVTEVKLAKDRLTLLAPADRGGPVEVLNPGGSSESAFLALAEAVRSGLDANRGYRPLE